MVVFVGASVGADVGKGVGKGVGASVGAQVEMYEADEVSSSNTLASVYDWSSNTPL